MNIQRIEIKELYKKYTNSDDYSLEDITFEINKGDFLGILGPNGAGKTTLLSIMCGLFNATSGTILINGVNAKNLKSIKKYIGVVPQEYALYPQLTAYENLEYFGAMFGLNKKEVKSNAINYLDYLGLKDFSNVAIEKFSGGMKRRVNLIAGLLHNPQLLFLDEPTVGVDVQSKNVMIDFLERLNQEGVTIIYTSHHLQEAQNLCNRLMILDDGKIITEGKPEDVIKGVEGASNLEEVFVSLTGKKLRDYV